MYELLAPVGDISKLDIALKYGADAVYLSGTRLGMRAACKNFELSALADAARITHACGKKLYVTLNIFPFDADFAGVDDYIEFLASIGTDGLIVSDLGLIARIAARRPDLAIHVSTQANVTNTATAAVYASMGVKRIVLARELSLAQIAKIRDGLDPSVELEAFVHGAMCISYSGRCLLSAYTTGRSANRGACNQECRMRFKPENSEEQFEFVEDDGTYIFGGNDLNMLAHLSELIDAGVRSFKIEGRVKSEYYVACVVNAYRKALDCAVKGLPIPKFLSEELVKAPNRGFNTGFYYGQPVPSADTAPYYEFVGLVVDETERGAVVEMRNRFGTGDVLEVLSFDDEYLNTSVRVPVMRAADGSDCTDAKVPMCRVLLPNVHLPVLSILRRMPKLDKCKNA